MIPKQISLRNFKCFGGEVDFTFPTEPGLYLVKGRNEVRPELEGNGCGKSTLFGDAITWCLFGKTPRLLKAGDVISWEVSGGASVGLEFLLRGKTYHLLRTQSPNALQLTEDGTRRTVDQLDVDRLLGVDFSGFMSSIVFSQFGTMFFDLGPTDKSALLSTILDLAVWDQATEQAKKSLTSLQSATQATRERMAKNEGLKAGWLARDLDALIAEWEEQHEDKITKLRETKEDYTTELEKIRKVGVKTEKKLAKSVESLTELTEIKQDVQKELNKAQNAQSELLLKKKGWQAKLELVAKERKKFENVSGECPYCRQEVTKDHIDQEVSRLNAESTQITDKITQIQDKIAGVKAEIVVIQEDFDLLHENHQEMLAEQAEFTEEKSKLKSQAAKIMGSSARLDEELNVLRAAKNPHHQELTKQQEIVRELDKNLADDAADLKDLDKKIFATQHWVKAFKEVRLSLIGDILIQLELEVNNKLFQLGLCDWRVDFAVEGVTKGGKITKGFTATITTPQNLTPVPWAAWSGGETQRLRLAGALGLADLIAAKSGLHANFEVYDEPSQYLSTSGIESLLSVLRERATSMNKTIFLIDHRNLDSTAFTGVCTVVKSHDGTMVVPV